MLKSIGGLDICGLTAIRVPPLYFTAFSECTIVLKFKATSFKTLGGQDTSSLLIGFHLDILPCF